MIISATLLGLTVLRQQRAIGKKERGEANTLWCVTELVTASQENTLVVWPHRMSMEGPCDTVVYGNSSSWRGIKMHSSTGSFPSPDSHCPSLPHRELIIPHSWLVQGKPCSSLSNLEVVAGASWWVGLDLGAEPAAS